jgi:hypothetical protein
MLEVVVLQNKRLFDRVQRRILDAGNHSGGATDSEKTALATAVTKLSLEGIEAVG